MAVIKDYFPMLAAGENNALQLKPLHHWQPPAFELYENYIDAVWYTSETQEESGKKRTVPVGLPYVIWRFPALTQKEFQLLKTTLGMTSQRDALCTLRAFDPYSAIWGNYNAVFKMPDDIGQKYNGYEWRELEFRFLDLRIIP
jgi:hypothetical protein